MDEEPLQKAKQAKRKIEKRWLGLSGVVAVGIGQGPEGEPTIVVSIERDDERIRGAVPPQVEGVPVEIRVTGPIRPL